MKIKKYFYYITRNNKYIKNELKLVGYTGFEPVTPALSRQCSEPTELITHNLKLIK